MYGSAEPRRRTCAYQTTNSSINTHGFLTSNYSEIALRARICIIVDRARVHFRESVLFFFSPLPSGKKHKNKMSLRQPRRDSDVILSNFNHKELLFKFLIIGDYGVGKTAIVRRYTEGKFSSNYKITIGADFAIKTLDWDPRTKINLQLWDIAGHERFGYMTRVYYKYAVAAALVFDISRVATFQSVKKWLVDLRDKVTLPDGSSIPIVLLANKCDIHTVSVPTEQIVKFCKENKIASWYITSAKENKNIDEAMRYLVESVLKAKIEDEIRDSIKLRETPEVQEKNNCCKS
ncbi:ras-related protein Rab-32-like [Venturia canescens]|uniref:ras-related protein Rab-32-like n=1 Tax=Venturia canescens TaxID=32260 RepID=UPI001C9CABFA|nr:ras-related protein Rab-32-like [Venturia canescens]